MLELSSHKIPYELDWGNVTPDGFDEKNQEIVHVFNFDISSKDKIDNCIIFSVGKIVWSHFHIPEGIKQKLVFDLRGQPLVFLERARKMKYDINEKLKKVNLSVVITTEILI